MRRLVSKVVREDHARPALKPLPTDRHGVPKHNTYKRSYNFIDSSGKILPTHSPLIVRSASAFFRAICEKNPRQDYPAKSAVWDGVKKF
jgi:hypothetical protein